MVYILLADGFEEAEALVPADLLRRAGETVFLTAACPGQALVTGGHGITVSVDCDADTVQLSPGDLVMLPGGMGGVNGLGQSEAAVSLIRRANNDAFWLAAICAAPTLLGKLDLLQGRKAVCYPGMESGLTGGVPCPGEQTVRDGRLITGEGPGAAFPFGLALVEALCGKETADKVAQDACFRR